MSFTGLKPEVRQKIVEKLQSKIPHLSCPMCKNSNFILGDAYFNNALQENFNGLILGGPSIPSIPVICNKCGFISQHAIGILGLFPSETSTQTTQTTTQTPPQGGENV